MTVPRGGGAPRWLVAAVMLTVLAFPTAGCGGDDAAEVAVDQIAVVDGLPIPKSDYDTLIRQANLGYTQQRRPFPKAGTAAFASIRGQIVDHLVRAQEYELEARELGVRVTEKQVDARVQQFVADRLGGSRERLDEELRMRGYTLAQVRRDIRNQLLVEALSRRATGTVRVPDREVARYYQRNEARFTQPESRELRHILVKTRDEAIRLRNRLREGADFAVLARRHSIDPGSKGHGGKLSISRGQTVAPFDQTAFLLGKGVLSGPVKTQFGYHILEPLTEVKPASVTPFVQVRTQIREQLLRTKRQRALKRWTDAVEREYESKVVYAKGFAPVPAKTPTRAETSQTTTE